MSRRTQWSIVLIFVIGVVGIGAVVGYRYVPRQRAQQEAIDIATQLGYQPQDLIVEYKTCPGMLNFGEQCWWKFHFQTTHTIVQMQTLLEHLPCTRLIDEQIGGNSFVNDLISSGTHEPVYANGQDLYEVQNTIPQPQARDWICPMAGQEQPITIKLYETSTTTNRYMFLGKVISKNIATVSVFIQ